MNTFRMIRGVGIGVGSMALLSACAGNTYLPETTDAQPAVATTQQAAGQPTIESSGVTTAATSQPATQSARPSMQAYRVADGAIKVDGRLDEWPTMPIEKGYARVAIARERDTLKFPLMRGALMGPADFSVYPEAAVDDQYLYISANITDQIMMHAGTAETAWDGDDFEVYVDASPADKRFAEGINTNSKQFIFVPENIMDGVEGTFIWHAKDNPGVKAASRLTPMGYTIEVAIPKALFPNWKADTNLDAVGFEIQCGDLDTPGPLGHDAGPKTQIFVMQPAQHFMSSAKLGLLKIDEQVTPVHNEPRMYKLTADYAEAQKILDRWSAPVNLGGVAPNWSALLDPANPLTRKAVAFVLERNPMMDDPAKLIAILDEKPVEGIEQITQEARPYAMIALAERKQLPAQKTFDLFAKSDDLILAQTAIWCLGKNGDKSIAPKLAEIYPGAKDLTKEYIAMSLAELGDATGAATLRDLVVRDGGQWSGERSAELLEQLGLPVPEMDQ